MESKHPVTVVLLSEEYVTRAILCALLRTVEGPVVQPAEVVIAITRPNQLHIENGSCYKIIFQEQLLEIINRKVPNGLLAALRPHFKMKDGRSISVSLYNFEPDAAIHTQCFLVTYPAKGGADNEVCESVESFLRVIGMEYQMVKE